MEIVGILVSVITALVGLLVGLLVPSGKINKIYEKLIILETKFMMVEEHKTQLEELFNRTRTSEARIDVLESGSQK